MKLSKKLLCHPISASFESLKKSINEIIPDGNTALGAGLVSAVALLIKRKPGSMIILCTDGLSNLGIGNLSNNGKRVISKKNQV